MPASPPLLRVARLTAAGLASRLGFSFDEIEDVKIAVDELCFVLVGTSGREGTFSLTYRLEEDSLVIEGESDVEGESEAGPSDLSVMILDAVVDEHRLDRAAGGLRFHLRKRRSGS